MAQWDDNSGMNEAYKNSSSVPAPILGVKQAGNKHSIK